MNTRVSYEKAGFLVVLAVLTAYFTGSITGLVNPAIASLASAYPDTSLNTIMLVSTLPMLFAIPTNFLFGTIVKKIGVKTALVFGLIVFIISSVVPFTMRTSFTPILVTRALNGLAYGLIFPLCPVLVNTYIEPEKRSTILGYGQSVTQGFGILLSTVVGIVAARSVYNIWLLNLIMCVPLILGLMLPKEPEWEAPAQDDAAQVKADAPKEQIPTVVIIAGVLAFLWFMFSYLSFLYLSPLVLGKGIGDATIAGLAQTMFSVGGVIAGLIFGKLFAKTGARVLSVGLFLLVLNYFIMAVAANPMMCYVANLLGGIGYSVVYVGFVTVVSMNCSPALFSSAWGIMSAIMSLGGFVSSYVISFIAGIAGQSGSFVFPFVFSGIVMAVMCVLLLIRPLKMSAG